jgi:hypothetical protein
LWIVLVNDCPKRCPITFNLHPELEINAANPAALEKRRGLLVRIVAATVLRQGNANVVVHVSVICISQEALSESLC